MKFEFEQNREILTVKIQGELDHHGARALRESIDNEIMASAARGLIIDLAGLEIMDSSGIGIIMGRCKLMETLGGHVCVAGARAAIKKVILLSGLGRLVGLCETAAEGTNILRSTKKIV
ncbi:MAG: anti-sigma factor antagonist [Bacillota bacterium]|nr:anti-sigma factor antagonist [Bacillota bacterium]